MPIKLSLKTYIKLLVVTVFILISAYFAVRYAIYRFNEHRGFCTAENKYLTNEEMKQAFITDFILFKMDFRRIQEHSHKAQVYISKYDMADSETIIELMTNADINKSFEENFGVIAKASVEEYYARKRRIESCQLDSVDCSNSEFDNSRYIGEGIKDLLNPDNSIDIDYINGLPDTYTFITRGSVGTNYVYLFPISLMSYQGNHQVKVGSYWIGDYCCDNQAIIESIGQRGPIPKNGKYSDLKASGQLSDKEPDINLEDIDGDVINNNYIDDLYVNLELNQPEQISRYSLRFDTARLRDRNKVPFPFVETVATTACGTLTPEEKVIKFNQG